MTDWTPAFRPAYQEAFRESHGLDIEESWKGWLTQLMGSEEKARAVHEKSLLLPPLPAPVVEVERELMPPTPSARELQVLRCMAYGLEESEAATHLGLAYETVRRHTSHLRDKFAARSTTLVVARAVRLGLLDDLCFL